MFSTCHRNFRRAWALGEHYTESEEFEKAEEFLTYAAELAPLLTGETSEETALCVNNLAMQCVCTPSLLGCASPS